MIIGFSQLLRRGKHDPLLTVQRLEAIERCGRLPAQLAVRLTVSDTGNGIAPEFLPRMFERFIKTPGLEVTADRRAWQLKCPSARSRSPRVRINWR